MEYMVIKDNNVADLSNSVNKFILKGWKPIGGVSVSLSESDDYEYFIACQAMIKE